VKVGQLVASSGQTGVETHLLALFPALARQGIRPILCCPEDGPLTEVLRAGGFEVRLAAPRGRLRLSDLSRLREALADVTLVHAHGPRGIFWSALLRPLQRGRSAVATVHELELTGAQDPVRRHIYRPVERWSLGRHDALLAVSRDLARRLEDRAGMPKDRVRVVPNCSSVLLRQRPAVALRPGPGYAVVAARLEPVKGVDLLIEAWGRLRDLGQAMPLRILGEGSARPALERQVAALGLGNFVRFDGLVRDAVPTIAGASLYVAPSRMEGLPGSVIEAMALGVPVVATRVGGNIDVLEAAAPEFLVSPEDPAALATAIARLRAMPDDAEQALRMRLQDEAYRRFHPDVVAAQVAAVYQECRGGYKLPDPETIP
jgi:glycosyltransferase involved in cell wall biosynthesis